VITKIRLF
jgi:hypothetical protein